MVLDLIVIKTDDGYTAEIPSIIGCECWAHDEDDVIRNVIELLRYYIKLQPGKQILIDKARKSRNKTIFKVVFDK